MSCLAIYDVVEIQNYIFSSTKLKENIGASILVHKLLEEYLPEAINQVARDKQVPVELDWKNLGNRVPILDEPTKSMIEVIYIGGGNALVAFRENTPPESPESLAYHVTQTLSRILLERTGGPLRFAVAYQPTDFKGLFNEDRKALFRILAKNKQEMMKTVPLLGIGVTMEGTNDGFPAATKEKSEDQFISHPADLKRQSRDSSYFKNRLLAAHPDYIFPSEFDELGQVEGENFIAIVHIDGNNMGQTIEKILQNQSDYRAAITAMRSVSNAISTAYETVMRQVIERLITIHNTSKLRDILTIQYDAESHKLFLPIRPLILNGDDVTFACHGKMGIPLAEEFLKLISQYTLPIETAGGDNRLSACAGVSIIKSHFPFHRAYQLAEELCASAKRKAKIIAQNSEAGHVGQWMDFHIVFSGVTTSLDHLRKKIYQVPGKDSPEKLITARYGKSLMEHSRYNLLWRPWCIAGELPNDLQDQDWNYFQEIFTAFQDRETWPRSKLKQLRNECLESSENIDLLLQEYASRGRPLPTINGSNKMFPKDNQTPYFDALELIDLYIPNLLNQEDSHEA